MKYHIFIGSTFDDLKKERREIQRIIMELGHIPVSAEYLDSTSKNYKKLLEKTVEECDFFIAVIANMYAPKGAKTSELEAECNIADKNNVPVISFIKEEKAHKAASSTVRGTTGKKMRSSARSSAAKKEKGAGSDKKLEALKIRLGKGTNETWLNSNDLCQKLQNQLVQQINLTLRNGWVRADQTFAPSVANELSRLSTENEQLRHQVKFDRNEIVTRLREQMKNTFKVLALNKIILSFYYASGEKWENNRNFRYLRIFKLLAHELTAGKTTSEISRFLGAALNPEPGKPVRKDYPIPPNTIIKIMADLSLLKLVRCVSKNERTGDNDVWGITEYGRELYSAYRMRQLNKALGRTGS
jgi:hypothetical protein